MGSFGPLRFALPFLDSPRNCHPECRPNERSERGQAKDLLLRRSFTFTSWPASRACFISALPTICADAPGNTRTAFARGSLAITKFIVSCTSSASSTCEMRFTGKSSLRAGCERGRLRSLKRRIRRGRIWPPSGANHRRKSRSFASLRMTIRNLLPHHDKRLIPGSPSKPESKVRICSIPCCSMMAACTASRADRRRCPSTICLARSTMAWSIGRT